MQRYLAYGLYPDEPMPETTEEESRKTEKTEEKKFEEEKKDVDKEPYKRFPPPTKEHIQSVLKTKDFKVLLEDSDCEPFLNGHSVVLFALYKGSLFLHAFSLIFMSTLGRWRECSYMHRITTDASTWLWEILN